MSQPERISPSGKREQQKEARRCAIIEAALEVFIAQGFTAAKLDDVAERAGIGKGTIYLYFDSKESLLEEVVRQTLFPSNHLEENYLSQLGSSASEILANHFRYIYNFMKNPKVPPLLMMIMGETVRFPKLSQFLYDEMISQSQQVTLNIIRKGIKEGEFRESAAQIYPQLLFAPAMHSAMWNLQFAEMAPIDMERFAEMHIDFMLRALRKDQ